MKAVKQGDVIGMGIFYPDDNTDTSTEQLVISYVTINRDVALTRVIYQPPGGFYPIVLVPPGGKYLKYFQFYVSIPFSQSRQLRSIFN